MKSICRNLVVVLFLVGISSCSFPKDQNLPQATTAAPEILETIAPTQSPSEVPPTQELVVPNTGADNPTEAATEARVEIKHELIPDTPKYNNDQKVVDCNTGERKSLGATTLIGVGCDNWGEADIERPADKQNGVYLPAVDIVRAQMGSNQSWLFGKVNLYKDSAGVIPAGLTVMFEIDTDLDSRGEYLITGTGLGSSEWTTDGVQVWWDQNEDVGGDKPHRPDGKPGDGFETLLFDAGRGEDADLAWVRVNSADGASIEFAFKSTLVPENQVFAWWAWTALGGLDPSHMEIVDMLEDGSSWNMDNTCSWIFNGRPSNLIVNICDFFIPTATPIPTKTPAATGGGGHSCPAGKVWSDKYGKCVDIGGGT